MTEAHLFQSAKNLLHNMAVLEQGLSQDVPQGIGERAQQWRLELDTHKDSAKATLFGPTISLYGKCGTGKSYLINCMVGWKLVPARTHSTQTAETHHCVELVSSVAQDDVFEIHLSTLTPVEWTEKLTDMLINATSSSPASAAAKASLVSIYGAGWRDTFQLEQLGEGYGRQDLVRLITTAQDENREHVRRFVADQDFSDVFGEYGQVSGQTGKVGFGRYNQANEADKEAAHQCLVKLCRAPRPREPRPREPRPGEPRPEEPSWYIHVVHSVRVQGCIGNLPKPCVIVDVPGIHDPNADRAQIAARNRSTRTGNACYHWLIVEATAPNLSDDTTVNWMRDLILDGYTCRLRIIANKCDLLRHDDDGITPLDLIPGMKAELEEHLFAQLRERLLAMNNPDNNDQGEQSADVIIEGLRERQLVFPCSAGEYTSMCAGRAPSRGFVELEDTGIPRLVQEIHDCISDQEVFFIDVLERYFNFLQRLQDQSHGVHYDANEALLGRLEEFETRALARIVASLRDGLQRLTNDLGVVCDSAVRRWQQNAQQLFARINAIQAANTLQAIGRKKGNHRGASVTIDMTADLLSSFVPNGTRAGEVEQHWVRLLGAVAGGYNHDGDVMATLRQFYTDVVAEMDAELFPDQVDAATMMREPPAVALRDAVATLRRNLTEELRRAVDRHLAATYRDCANQSGKDTKIRCKSILTSAPVLNGGYEARRVVMDKFETICRAVREQAERHVIVSLIQPRREQLSESVTTDEAGLFVRRLLHSALSRLADSGAVEQYQHRGLGFTVDDVRASLEALTPVPPADGADADEESEPSDDDVVMCPICYVNVITHETVINQPVGCMCTRPYRLCGICAEQLSHTTEECPHCRNIAVFQAII